MKVSSGQKRLHPRLDAELARLTLTDDGSPDRASWDRLVESVNQRYREWDEAGLESIDAMRGWSSFENLFRISPVPIMEQDYSALEDWMGGLRDQGVTSLREHLGDDIEAIREIVPLIRIVAANPAAVTAVGLPLESLIGPIDPRIVNEGSQDGWLNQLDAVWNREPEAHSSYTAATANGKTYDAESILSAPLVDGEPDFSRAVFTVLDVTGHRNEERRMQELMAAKNRFLASVSHEIRTPLTAILGFARIIEDDRTLDDDDRALMISSIVQYSQEVADLVEDLLVAARADMGQLEVAHVRFDVAAQLAKTMQAGGSFTTEVTVESEAEPIWAIGDTTRIRQILRNLLTNAERYGGSTVTVRVTSDNGRVYVDVADDGPVLASIERERIFEPYYRIAESPGLPGSVGIGLAISRQLAQLMRGSLDYRRQGDFGYFRLTLPAARH